MSDTQPKTEQQALAPPPAVLYGFLLRVFAVFMLVVVWAGHYFLESTWPAPLKLWLCTALGAGAILHGIFGRGLSIRTIAPPGSRRVISPLHAFGLVALVIAEGIFLTWVAAGPPH
ncbi:MAG: hypothetical protein ABSF38_20615 [Verrucomicrobiota bacterium]|jgi:hypothetical protein